ncbi:MAG TPA: hypothetical protein VFG89_00895 [Coriobacteriia bacterium]|nr:hypothetical protein [Coriobacteriia bacterium]
MQNNQTLVIGLVIVAVLLAGVAGVVIYQQSQAVPAASPTAATTPGAANASAATSGTAASAAAPAASSVDAASATKVPKGTEPKAFVEGYYKACDKGDWQAAFDALPADKKTGNSPDALKEQVSGYGIKGYTITDAQVQGDTATIKVDQVTESYGTFENTWTFAKKDGVWFVSSKAVTGMK